MVVLSVSVGLMWQFGLFVVPKDDTGAKTLAASLGLVGSMFTAVVALVGTVLKYAIDDRAATQAETEARRNSQLAREEGYRNRVDIAIRAVALLGENNADANQSQIAGAVLALVDLGEVDLAVALLSELWPKGLVSSAVASQVLDAAFASSSAATMRNAAVVMVNNGTRLADERTTIWPFLDRKWPAKLEDNCRLGLVLAAVDWLKSDIQRAGLDSATDCMLVLYGATSDADVIIGDIAASALRPVVQLLPDDWEVNLSGTGAVDMPALQAALEKYASGPYQSQYAVDAESSVRALLSPSAESTTDEEETA